MISIIFFLWSRLVPFLVVTLDRGKVFETNTSEYYWFTYEVLVVGSVFFCHAVSGSSTGSSCTSDVAGKIGGRFNLAAPASVTMQQ